MGYWRDCFGSVYVYGASPERIAVRLQRKGRQMQEIKESIRKADSKQDKGRKYNCLSVRNGSRYGHVCRRDRLEA